MTACPPIPAARFAFCLCFMRFVFVFVPVLSGEPKQNQGRGLVDRKPVQAPVILLLAVPRRLFCFGSLVIFRCGALLFMIIHVIYKYKNR